jgi:hypothetical protein
MGAGLLYLPAADTGRRHFASSDKNRKDKTMSLLQEGASGIRHRVQALRKKLPINLVECRNAAAICLRKNMRTATGN